MPAKPQKRVARLYASSASFSIEARPYHLLWVIALIACTGYDHWRLGRGFEEVEGTYKTREHRGQAVVEQETVAEIIADGGHGEHCCGQGGNGCDAVHVVGDVGACAHGVLLGAQWRQLRRRLW